MKNYGFLFLCVCLIGALVFSSLLYTPAFADSVASFKPTVKLAANFGITFVGAVATGLLGVFVHGNAEAKLRQALQTALEAAAAYAVMKIDSVDWTDIKVKNKLIQLGVEYAQTAVPKALKWFGITPERLADMVLARLANHAPLEGAYIDASTINFKSK